MTRAAESDDGLSRHFLIGGLTVRVESEIPFSADTFAPKFAAFASNGPGNDTMVVRHHFSLPVVDRARLGREVYRRAPWAIHRGADGWTYLEEIGQGAESSCLSVSMANEDHTVVDIFNGPTKKRRFRHGGLASLTMFPTDQIVLARVFADRNACFLHSGGVVLDGQGLLFVGHSEAGKSTMMTLLQDHGQALCDDRNIVRLWNGRPRVHGTWSHGEVPTVSSASAPLGAILFLRKADVNRLEPLMEPRDVLPLLLPCLIKPLVTSEWWEKTLDVAGSIARVVPCYTVHFDMSEAIVDMLKELVRESTG